MYVSDLKINLNQSLYPSCPTAQSHQLSPMARYYICKFLRRISDDASAELLAFTRKLSVNNCTLLEETLQQTYPNEAELTQVLFQLDSLIHLYTNLSSQSTRYLDCTTQATQIKQKILQLLGFKKSEF